MPVFARAHGIALMTADYSIAKEKPEMVEHTGSITAFTQFMLARAKTLGWRSDHPNPVTDDTHALFAVLSLMMERQQAALAKTTPSSRPGA